MNWINTLKQMERASRELLGLARAGVPDAVDKDAQTEILEQIWQKRQRLVSRLVMLSHKLRPTWDTWPQCLENLRQEQVNEVAGLLQSARHNGREVLKLDSRLKPELEKMLEQTRDELMELNHTSMVLQAYRPPVLINPQHALPSQLSRTT